jgi:hypothetical protein
MSPLIPAIGTGTAERRGWTAEDMADYFEALDEHTVGMSHPERVAWLANELSLHGDDDLTASKNVAWDIIALWEAKRNATSILSRIAADPNVDPSFRAVLSDIDSLAGEEEHV